MSVNDKVATIVPVHHLDLIKDHAYFMALSYCFSAEYAEFFSERTREGKYVMLDNSAIELGDPEPFPDYLRKAIMMHAQEIMLPDIFGSPSQTLDEALKVMNYYGNIIKQQGLNVMVIPQGREPKDWVTNMRGLAKLVMDTTGKYPTVGISYRYNKLFGGDRRAAVDYALRLGFQVHLLGCSEDPRRHVQPLLSIPGVRGVDSSYPTIYAAHDMKLELEDFDKPRPERIVDFRIDIYEDSLLKYNIDTWRKACDYETSQGVV